MAYELKATVKEIGETQQVSEKFKKRDLVLTDLSKPEYPQHIKFDLNQDKVTLADNLKIGDKVSISFNLGGREYTKDNKTSYFNSLQIWKLTKLSDTAPQQAQIAEPQHIDNKDIDDVPF